MNGIAGVGGDDGVAGPDDGEEEMRESVLGSDGDDGFLFGVEVDVVIRFVALDDGLAKIGDTLRRGVAMVARIAGGFDELVDDGARSGSVGIAHAEVDHIELRRACFGLHLIDDGEDVGRELLDAIELVIWLHLFILASMLRLSACLRMAVRYAPEPPCVSMRADASISVNW